MAVIYLVESKSDDAHTTALTTSFVCHAKPYLTDSATETASLKRVLLDAVNKVTIVVYYGMVFLPKPFELALKLRVCINDYFHGSILFHLCKEILCTSPHMRVTCSSLTYIGNTLTHRAC